MLKGTVFRPITVYDAANPLKPIQIDFREAQQLVFGKEARSYSKLLQLLFSFHTPETAAMAVSPLLVNHSGSTECLYKYIKVGNCAGTAGIVVRTRGDSRVVSPQQLGSASFLPRVEVWKLVQVGIR
jgi:hypothetical protein